MLVVLRRWLSLSEFEGLCCPCAANIELVLNPGADACKTCRVNIESSSMSHHPIFEIFSVDLTVEPGV